MRGSLRARAAVVAVVSVVGLAPVGPAQSATSYTVSDVAAPGLPFAITVDSTEPRAYLAQGNGSGVLVLDTETNQLTGTIPVAGAIGALAVDPERHRVYASLTDKTLVEIDTQSRTVVDRLSVGVAAQRMVLDPGTHKLYISTGSSNLAVVDPAAARNPVASVSLGGTPTSLAVEPARHRVYVSHFFGPGITAIDTASDTIAVSGTVGREPGALAVDPGASLLYVADGTDGRVQVVSTGDGRPVATIEDPVTSRISAIALDPGAGVGYLAHASGFGTTVTVVDTTRYAVVTTLTTGSATDLAVDTGSHQAFLPGFPDPAIRVITPTTDREPQSVTFVSTPPTDPAVGTSYRVRATGSPTGPPVLLSISSASAGVCRFVGAAAGDRVASPARMRFTAPGRCTITAQQPGDRDHLPSSKERQTVVVR